MSTKAIDQPRLRLSRKWFNPLYFILLEILKDPGIRTVLVYGGKSSSKTASISQVLCREAMYGANSIAFRKESTLIQTTLKKSLELGIKTMRLDNAFEKLLFQFRCANGAEIVMKGLDDPEKAKGVESYKHLYLDELNHFLYEEWEQFQLSLRGIAGQKIWAAWNPVSESSWVKTKLVDAMAWTDTDEFGTLPNPDSFIQISEDRKTVLIRTNYQDNFWIVGSPCGTYGYRDENLIHEYNATLSRNLNAYRVNVLGEWGSIRTGGEFFKQFDETKHVKPVRYDKFAGSVHVTIDENVTPYVTVAPWQVLGKSITQVHEIPCKAPDNNAPKAAAKLVSWLRSVGHEDVVFIYGDPSAGKRSTIDENNASFYDKFIEVLTKAGYRVIKRVGRGAPQVALSAAFVNDIYEQELYGYTITISDTCKVSIGDYAIVKEAPDGTMLKATVKDKSTGVTYEPHGHFSDAKRYFITKLLEADFTKYRSKSKSNLAGIRGAFG